MNATSINTHDQKLEDALARISQLEQQIAVLRRNTNAIVNGQTIILASLVAHTTCPPPPGTEFVFTPRYDVGV